MARTINCDWPACTATADYMLTVLGNGETRGFCTGHYLASCGAFVLAAGGEELDEGAATAIAALSSPSSTEPDPALAGELWTCQVCGLEFPSEEQIVAHVAETHTAPPDDNDGEQIVSRETIESPA